MCGKLGHNSLIFSFSAGASPVHNNAGGIYPQLEDVLRKKLINMMAGGSALIICHCRSVLLDAVH